jgi:hypothetical protein
MRLPSFATPNIGVVKWKGGGAVAVVTNCQHWHPELVLVTRAKGKGFVLLEMEVSRTGLRREIRRESFTTKAAAQKARTKWDAEIKRRNAAEVKAETAAAAKEAAADPFGPRPANVDSEHAAGKHDLARADEAQLAALRATWPRTLSALDRKAAGQELAQAYLLDVTESTGNATAAAGLPPMPPTPELINRLHAAQRNAARRRNKNAPVIDYWLAFNWPALVYLSDPEIAERLKVETGIAATPGGIKQRRYRLNLTTRRPPGPTPRG